MQTVDFGGYPLQLTTKEKRLFDWDLECEDKRFQPTIGDTCNACHTTVFTLLSKTRPSLGAKIDALLKAAREELKANSGMDDKAIQEWLQREG